MKTSQFSKQLALKKGVKFFLIVLTSLYLFACGGSEEHADLNPPKGNVKTQEKIESLWNQVIPDYMAQVPWEDVNLYDAGHVLMLPLEYAFSISNDSILKNDFHQMFEDYLVDFDSTLELHFVSRFQFFYLAIRYLRLSQKDGFSESQARLFDRILEHTLYVYFDFSTRHSFNNIGTLEEVLQSKLDLKGQPVHPLSLTINDLELHSFAVAAEIAAIQRDDGEEVSAGIQRILDLAYETFKAEVVYTETGWLFQPGQWQSYVDYAYAGHDFIQPGLEISIVEGIATDSSHSHRMPLWLLSQQNAYPDGHSRKAYFQSLSQGFEDQFMNVVYTRPTEDYPGPRMTNYMDGHNGLYQYKDRNLPGIKDAYEAYNLSGTMLIGFFPFMYNSELADDYAELQFPLHENLAELYLGLGPAIDPDASAITLPKYHQNGFAEMNMLIASLMSSQP